MVVHNVLDARQIKDKQMNVPDYYTPYPDDDNHYKDADWFDDQEVKERIENGDFDDLEICAENPKTTS